MEEKVRVSVQLPATREVSEFRLSLGLTVADAVKLIAHMLSVRAGPRFEATGEEDLALCEGPYAGALLRRDATVRHLVADGVVADGTLLVLV